MVSLYIIIKVILPLVFIVHLCDWYYRIPRLARSSLVWWLIILHITRSLWW